MNWPAVGEPPVTFGPWRFAVLDRANICARWNDNGIIKYIVIFTLFGNCGHAFNLRGRGFNSVRWDPKRRITPTEATRHEFVIGCALGSTPSGVLALPRLPASRPTRSALLHSQSAGDVAAMLGRA
ncbi:jg7849 [Pararge aegeria aegeria]|uniref:Jg7849 protein n=1 Tax=Pararge aegeria aegeria TaxID=348720 RepID=A0A8S4S4L4_9NEOP|nr:jg7849 [Pararge aegeria aegeria]